MEKKLEEKLDIKLENKPENKPENKLRNEVAEFVHGKGVRIKMLSHTIFSLFHCDPFFYKGTRCHEGDGPHSDHEWVMDSLRLRRSIRKCGTDGRIQLHSIRYIVSDT